MEIPIRIDLFTVIIFLGVCQGFFLSMFFLLQKKIRRFDTIFLGIYILSVSIIALELLLNYSGYITKLLILENFAEPINFLMIPTLYLAVKSMVGKNIRIKDFLHLVPFVLYTIYMIPYYIQSSEWKLRSFLFSNRPEIKFDQITPSLDTDALGLRSSIIIIVGAYFLIYNILMVRELITSKKDKRRTIQQISPSIFVYNQIIVSVLYLLVIIVFGRDLGDYIIASYIGVTMYIFSGYIIKQSKILSPISESYSSSNLNSEDKKRILYKISHVMKNDRYYLKNTASLPEMSNLIGESKHLVSQVINQEFQFNFFALLAKYRIEEACEILKDPNSQNITIEELSEIVGYNSKTSFNNAFKKLMNTTPSEYRKG